MYNGKKPAFPVPDMAGTPGMSKGEYMATKFMAAMIVNSTEFCYSDALIAKQAAAYATALLEELEKA